jgi:hypothetical protein
VKRTWLGAAFPFEAAPLDGASRSAPLGAARAVALLLIALLAAGCARPARTVLPGPVPPAECTDAAEVSESIFLVGDAGAPKLPPHPEAELPVDPVLRNLREQVMEQAGALGVAKVTVIYLGDNVYPNGLAPVGMKGRARGERVLRQQITAAGPARVIFLAGNHDWDIEGPLGWDHIRAQQGFLSTQGPQVSMLPQGGCSGPERVDFGKHLRFVFIDPIGFGHALDSPEIHAEVCPYDTAVDAFLALGREFETPEGRHMVLALHHPLITAGPHGGHFSLKQHLFPLTDFWPWLYLPLPIIGSIYPLSRQLGVTGTDATSDAYAGTISGIYRATRPQVPILFAGGHEHSLQLHRDAIGAYYLVSGAGSASEVTRVSLTPTAMYAEAVPGYMRLDLHANGALTLEATAIEREQRRVALRHCIAEGPPP